MAEVASESWWIKLGIMYDKSGFKAAILGMADLKSIAGKLADEFKRVVDVNSDLYRTAHNLNMSTRDLQLWERVFKTVHGTVEEARGDIENLNYAYDELRLGLGGKKAEIAARLHLAPGDLVDFETAMKALNRSFNQEFGGSRDLFIPLLKQLGLSKSAIYLITQSSRDFENRIKEVSRIPLIPEHQIKAAERLQEQFEKLKINFDNFKSGVISASFPALSNFMKDLERVMLNPEVQRGIKEFFTTIEEELNRLATDDNIKTLVSDLAAITKLVGYGAKGALWLGHGYAQGAQLILDVEKERQNGGIDWKNRLTPLAGAVRYIPGLGPLIPPNQTFNININESKEPQVTAEAIMNAARKREAEVGATRVSY